MNRNRRPATTRTAVPTKGDAVRHLYGARAEGVVVRRYSTTQVVVSTAPGQTEVWYNAALEII